MNINVDAMFQVKVYPPPPRIKGNLDLGRIDLTNFAHAPHTHTKLREI